MILVLSDLYFPFPGGGERLIGNLSRDLMRRGHEVQVLTGYETPQQFDGPPVERHDLPLDAEGWAIIAEALVRFDPQVILTHHIYARTFAAQLEATGIPIVQVVLNGQRMPFAALAIHISEWVRERANARDDDITLLPPVFDDVVASSHGEAIGFIKPIEHKGVEMFYKIARAMPERRFVVLRGEWQDLEVIEPMENVTFMEPVADIRDFWSQCRLVLVPSRSEDAGTVAQEATANRLPCISSNVDGLAETNAGGITLDRDALGEWLHMIRSLDDPEEYRWWVERQQSQSRLVDQTATLDAIAKRIADLEASSSTPWW